MSVVGKPEHLAARDGWTLRRWDHCHYKHGWMQLELTDPHGQRLWFFYNGRRFARNAWHCAMARQHPELFALIGELLGVPVESPRPSGELRRHIAQLSPTARRLLASTQRAISRL